MKKIGVITSYFATNFGAALQCYALKTILEELGFYVDYIRYKQPNLYKMFYPFYWRNFISTHPSIIVKNIVGLPGKVKKWNNFKKFRELYIQPASGYVRCVPQDYDYYILGSDQIWNPYITGGFDDVFWGRFEHSANSKILSYAASTENMNYTNQNETYIRNAINCLSNVSVREDSLRSDLVRISGRQDIETVLDPTLLIPKEKYERIGLNRPLPQKYVLFYKIRKCTPFLQKIKAFASKQGMKVLILSSSIDEELKSIAKNDNDIIYMPIVGVEYFVSSIKYAEHIFTPSFHGTAFSIIFRKQFSTLVIEDNWNDRTTDLLNKFHLSDRQLHLEDDINLNAVDYTDTDIKLPSLQKKSMNYLLKSLQL